MTQKAPEAFRTISEVASDLDLPQHVLRFWETRFSQIKPMKRGGGRRYYRPEDVDLLRGIRHLLYGEGYTIKGVKRILKERGVRHVMDAWKDDQPPVAPPALPAPPVAAQSASQAQGVSPAASAAAPEPRPNPEPVAPPTVAPAPITESPGAPDVAAVAVAARAGNGSAAVHIERPAETPGYVSPAAPGHASAAQAGGYNQAAPPAIPPHAMPAAPPAPTAPAAEEGQLPQIGALRQVSTGAGAATAASPPHTEPAPASAAPVPGPAVPHGPTPPQSGLAQPVPAQPVPAPAVAPSPPPSSVAPVPAPAVAPAPAMAVTAVLGSEGRQKLQAALYELTECRRILFDALRAGEE